ncbi:MAG: ABC-2 type transport system permease protein [Myxococcota bacterium]|jgi:ABC-2 type transport system permease protein
MGPALAMARLYLRNSVFKPRAFLVLALVVVNVIVAMIVRSELDDPAHRIEDMINDMVLGFVLPFTALIYGIAIIRDEVDNGTLPYLLMRPIPRSAFYLGRMGAAVVCVMVVALTCTLLNSVLLGASAQMAPMSVVLGALTYVAIYAAISTFFSRPFMVAILLTLAERGLSEIPIAGAYASVRANLVNIAGLEKPDALQENIEQLLDAGVDVSTSYGIVLGLLAASVAIGLSLFERQEFTGEVKE